MIQLVTFCGSNFGMSEAAKQATGKANEFFRKREIKQNMIISQTVNTHTTEADSEIWAEYTITLLLDLPFEYVGD